MPSSLNNECNCADNSGGSNYVAVLAGTGPGGQGGSVRIIWQKESASQGWRQELSSAAFYIRWVGGHWSGDEGLINGTADGAYCGGSGLVSWTVEFVV